MLRTLSIDRVGVVPVSHVCPTPRWDSLTVVSIRVVVVFLALSHEFGKKLITGGEQISSPHLIAFGLDLNCQRSRKSHFYHSRMLHRRQEISHTVLELYENVLVWTQ